MPEIMLNDFFARTYLDVASYSDSTHLSNIISRYEALGVKTIFFAYDFDPSSSVSIHIEKRSQFKRQLFTGKKTRIKTDCVSVIPLIHGISLISGIERLTLLRGGIQYLFISIPPATDADTLISEMRSIIYDKKYTPVITGIEKAALSISDSATASLYKIPRAVYQIDFSSLSSRTTRELVKQMLTTGKTVIFGSGEKFDLCLYENFDYYIKLLSRAMGSKSLGYFTLRHNRVFH